MTDYGWQFLRKTGHGVPTGQPEKGEVRIDDDDGWSHFYSADSEQEAAAVAKWFCEIGQEPMEIAPMTFCAVDAAPLPADIAIEIADQMSADDMANFEPDAWREGVGNMLQGDWAGADLDAVLAAVAEEVAGR